jgi:hypothetical protein
MDFSEYVAIDAINASALRDISVSPRNYHRKRLRPTDKDSYRVGRAVHTAVFEPDRFLRDYVLWPAGNGKRAGKKWDAFQAAHVQSTILREPEYDRALSMRDAVRSHPIASRFLGRGEAEVTLQWTWRGQPCKARVDWVQGSEPGWIDLKTTRDPSPHHFEADCVRYGYHLQCAWYAFGMRAHHLPPGPVRIIAAQNVEPFDVAVYEVPELALDVGWQRAKRAFETLLRCRQTDTWPGAYPDELMLTLPDWAVSDEELALTMNGNALAL